MRKGNSPLRVEEILIQVSDVSRSVKFYRDDLGIALKPTGYGDNSFEGRVGEVRLLLHPDFDKSLKGERRGLGVHIHLWVRDVEAYYAQLRKRKVHVIGQPEDRPWGRHLAVLDPDGYRIEILGPKKIARSPRSRQRAS